ncbi:MAG: acyl-CoA dehydrogenase [Longimonas sp.]|uniref:acyl-CoA dehydrogenase family protein n=1 Tax=Longimonas sp. TaxID=2039626 RepID=UPI0039767267
MTSSPNTGTAPNAADYPADVLAVLPLLYVAWADGVITPSEHTALRKRLQSFDWMDPEHRDAVQQWLDPEHPPTPTEYQRWRRRLQKAATDLPVTGRTSLAALGAEMASLGGDGAPGMPNEAQHALREVEAALGIAGDEIVDELRGERPAPSEEVPSGIPCQVERLKAYLDGEHAELRDQIRTLLTDPVFRYDSSLGTEAKRERVLYWCRLLADQGLGALAFPKEYGGTGSIDKFITAFETLSYHDLSLVIKFGVQFGLFGGSVHQLGSARHHEKYLEDIGTLELPGCFAMSELGHGSNVRDLETTATYDAEAEEFVINTPHNGARKEWIGNAARHGRVATVFAQLHTSGEDYGVHAFVVPIRDEAGTPKPRVRIEDCGQKMGLNGVDNGRLWFDHVRIPRENLLNRYADVHADGTYESDIPSAGRRFFTMLSTLVGGRISVARSACSAAKSGLTIAVRYGNRRRQFGPQDEPEVPILDYRTHQRRLLPRLAKTYAIHTALAHLTQEFAARGPDDSLEDIEAEANALKAYSTWHTTDVLQTAREACGGQGYLAENRIAALKADTDVYTTFEGDNTVLLLQVAKGLLSDFQREFRDMNVFNMVQFVASDLGTRLKEKNPLIRRNTDSEHLRDPEFHSNAFRYRSEALLQSAARRLKKRIDDGMDTYDAFIEVQDHLVTLAKAKSEQLVFDHFHASIQDTEYDDVRGVLRTLCTLFALEAIESDRGWFLEQNYIDGSKAKAIRHEVNVLCKEVRPMAEPLVDAFAIPNACLHAPIAQKKQTEAA